MDWDFTMQSHFTCSFQFVLITIDKTAKDRQVRQQTHTVRYRLRGYTEGNKYLCQQSMGALEHLNFTQHFPFVFQSMSEKPTENMDIPFYVCHSVTHCRIRAPLQHCWVNFVKCCETCFASISL